VILEISQLFLDVFSDFLQLIDLFFFIFSLIVWYDFKTPKMKIRLRYHQTCLFIHLVNKLFFKQLKTPLWFLKGLNDQWLPMKKLFRIGLMTYFQRGVKFSYVWIFQNLLHEFKTVRYCFSLFFSYEKLTGIVNGYCERNICKAEFLA